MCRDACYEQGRPALHACTDLRDTCVVCADGTPAFTRPSTCPTGHAPTVRNSRWVCVDPATCCPEPVVQTCACAGDSELVREPLYGPGGCLVADTCACDALRCDDGTERLCDSLPPQCPVGTARAVRDSCWICVEPDTCEEPCPAGEVLDPLLAACCPVTVVVQTCDCPDGTLEVSDPVLDAVGCITAVGCRCEPP